MIKHKSTYQNIPRNLQKRKTQEVDTLKLYNCLFRAEMSMPSFEEDLSDKFKFKCFDTAKYKNKITGIIF